MMTDDETTAIARRTLGSTGELRPIVKFLSGVQNARLPHWQCHIASSRPRYCDLACYLDPAGST